MIGLLKKKKIYLIGLFILAILLLVVSVLLESFNEYELRQSMLSGLPQRTPSRFITEETQDRFSRVFRGTPTPIAQTRLDNIRETLRKMGKTRNPTPAEKTLKEQVIDKASSQKGGDYLLAQTDNYFIEYVKFPDLFFVTLTTDPIEKYQKEVEQWFIDQGFKQEELCSLGINFVIERNLQLKIGYEVRSTLSYCL